MNPAKARRAMFSPFISPDRRHNRCGKERIQ